MSDFFFVTFTQFSNFIIYGAKVDLANLTNVMGDVQGATEVEQCENLVLQMEGEVHDAMDFVPLNKERITNIVNVLKELQEEQEVNITQMV